MSFITLSDPISIKIYDDVLTYILILYIHMHRYCLVDKSKKVVTIL